MIDSICLSRKLDVLSSAHVLLSLILGDNKKIKKQKARSGESNLVIQLFSDVKSKVISYTVYS